MSLIYCITIQASAGQPIRFYYRDEAEWNKVVAEVNLALKSKYDGLLEINDKDEKVLIRRHQIVSVSFEKITPPEDINQINGEYYGQSGRIQRRV
jgi:hypothetical protein